MNKGISNFQIENAIDNIGDEDLNNNFVGVFPSNCMNKFINHSAMISSKKENVPLLLETLTAVKRVGHIGGVYLILNQKLIFFSFILLGLMV